MEESHYSIFLIENISKQIRLSSKGIEEENLKDVKRYCKEV